MRNRHGEEEPAALAGCAFYPNSTVVQFDQVFGDGQAESGSSILHRHGFSTVEPFKDPREVLRRDPATCITDANLHESLWSRSGLGQNSSPFRRELDGVL